MWSPTHVQVTVYRAKNLIVKGKSGTNDTYVTIKLGDEKYQTSIKERSVDPEWMEECDLPLADMSGVVHLNVYHRNLLGLDEFLGHADIPLEQFNIYERPRSRWNALQNKLGSKKAEKYRGEIETKITFIVQSMSSSQLSLNVRGNKPIKRSGSIKTLGEKITMKWPSKSSLTSGGKPDASSIGSDAGDQSPTVRKIEKRSHTHSILPTSYNNQYLDEGQKKRLSDEVDSTGTNESKPADFDRWTNPLAPFRRKKKNRLSKMNMLSLSNTSLSADGKPKRDTELEGEEDEDNPTKLDKPIHKALLAKSMFDLSTTSMEELTSDNHENKTETTATAKTGDFQPRINIRMGSASGVAPQGTPGISESSGAAPQGTPVISESSGAAPQGTPGISESSGAAPQGTPGISERSVDEPRPDSKHTEEIQFSKTDEKKVPADLLANCRHGFEERGIDVDFSQKMIAPPPKNIPDLEKDDVTEIQHTDSPMSENNEAPPKPPRCDPEEMVTIETVAKDDSKAEEVVSTMIDDVKMPESPKVTAPSPTQAPGTLCTSQGSPLVTSPVDRGDEGPQEQVTSPADVDQGDGQNAEQVSSPGSEEPPSPRERLDVDGQSEGKTSPDRRDINFKKMTEVSRRHTLQYRGNNAPRAAAHELHAGILGEYKRAQEQRDKALPEEVLDQFKERSREDLIRMILEQRHTLHKKEVYGRDLENYIDNLLVKVMEQTPKLLQNPRTSPPKAYRLSSTIPFTNQRPASAVTTNHRAELSSSTRSQTMSSSPPQQPNNPTRYINTMNINNSNNSVVVTQQGLQNKGNKKPFNPFKKIQQALK